MELPVFSTDSFDTFLKPFQSYFSIPQYRNFKQYFYALILSNKKKTLTNLHHSDQPKVNYDSLHHFISSSPWDEQTINEHRIISGMETIAEKATTAEKPSGFFIGDDTTNPKRGDSMPGFGYYHSGVEGRRIPSQSIVASTYHFDGFDLPLHASLYKNKTSCDENNETFQTKNELLIEHIHSFDFPEEITTFALLDAFYFNEKVIKVLQEKNIDSIGRLKSNRRLLIDPKDPDGCRLDLWFHYLKTRKPHPFKRITILNSSGKKEPLWIHEKIIEIKNLGKVKIVLACNKLRGQKSKPLFIGSTDTNLSAEEILTYYFKRWSIETFFWTIKQKLGFNHYQMRSELATTRHWYLVFFAYTYLSMSKLNQDPNASIGQIQILQQQENTRQFIRHVCSKSSKQRHNPDLIYSKLVA